MSAPNSTPSARRRGWHILAVACLALPLAACQGERSAVTGFVPLTVEERHPHYVAPEQIVLDLPANPKGMTRAERRAVDRFVTAYRQEGKGVFEVVAPSGSRNEPGARAVVGEVRHIARAGGIPSSALSYTTYHSKQAKPPVMLRYTRYMASAECGQWPEDLRAHWDNRNYHNFGCATQRNLAAMVEDPRDLQGPRRMSPRDSQRRDVIFGNYRRGEPTGAQSDTDSAGTASTIGD